MTTRASRAWRWYLGAGTAATVLVLALPVGLVRDLLFCLIAFSAAGAIVLAVTLHPPTRRLPWYLMAAGVALWAGGDLLWALFAHVLDIDPFPSAADVLYLAAYPVLAAGIVGLGRSDRRERSWAPVVDALIVGTAASLLLWVVFIEPAWTDPQGTFLERLVGVAYPVGDLVLISFLVHLGASALLRTPALRLLAAAFAVVLVADLLFQAVDYWPALAEQIELLDAGWLTAYVLSGTAALHPSMARPATSRSADRMGGGGRVAFLGVASLSLPVVLLVEQARGMEVHVTEVGVAAALIVALATARTAGLLRRLRDQTMRLERLADTDFVTGLENSRRLRARLDHELDRLVPAPVGVLGVALDRFTEINETLGPRVGDAVLRAIGDRLVAVVGERGSVARTVGEGFGVVVPGLASGRAATRLAEEVLSCMAEPFPVADLTVTVDAWVGVALGPADGKDSGELMHRVDLALAAARSRPEHVARYAEQMGTGGVLTSQLMADLRGALDSGQVVVHYQPQVEVLTGRVLGVEALVRWQHPEHGLVPPLAFIPAAERTGLIRPLTSHVLELSLAQCAGWRAEGRNLAVAVNLSVRNLLDPRFVDEVRSALARHALPASSLELEVTETSAMVDPNRAVEVLGALDEMGVTLSVDDYGTGYSSLAYLQRLPLRRLKIDRSFVAGVVGDGASAAIVRSTIELARHLGLAVVAEGVEDDATLLALADMGCFAAQGYGLGRPAPVEQVPAMVRDIESRVPTVLGVRLPQPRGEWSVPARVPTTEGPA